MHMHGDKHFFDNILPLEKSEINANMKMSWVWKIEPHKVKEN
jgi:hypothetical protein